MTLLATITLALGIGATTMIASLVNAVILRTHDYLQSDRLVRVAMTNRPKGYDRWGTSIPDYLDFREHSRAFASLAAFDWADETLSESGLYAPAPERVRVGYVSANLFPSLPIHARLGRTFKPEDEASGASPVAVLSHDYWQSRFGGSTDVLGRTIRLSGHTHTIIGVMPEGLLFPPAARPAALWTPLLARQRDPGWNTRDRRTITIWGYLRPAVTKVLARDDVSRVAEQIAQAHPETNRGLGANVWTLDEWSVPASRRAVTVLLGAVAVLLLIACANVANLLLARASSRQREIATLLAVGASPAQVVRQVLAESLLMSLIAGLVGLGLAAIGIGAIRSLLPPGFYYVGDIGIDGTVLVITLGVTIVTALVFGLAPAWAAARTNVNAALQAGARQGEGRGPQRLRAALVISEIGLSLVLLVGMGLLLRSFVRLQQADLGFRTEGVLTFRIDLPEQQYPDAGRIIGFTERLTERLRALPGVESVAVTNDLPLQGDNVVERRFALDGRRDDADAPSALLQMVSTEYFRTLSISIVAGRLFTDADVHGATGVAIVDGAFVKKHLSGQNPIGKRLTLRGPAYGGHEDYGPETRFEIVGVLPDVKHFGPEVDQFPRLYVPFRQKPWPHMGFTIRTSDGTDALVPALRKELQATDQDQAAFGIQTLDARFEERMAQDRWNTLLTTLIAVIALIFTAVGTYGVMAHFVTRRRQEIGLRMALGAHPRSVVLMVLRDAMLLTVPGIAIGLAAAWASSHLMTGLLFDVNPNDPLVFAGGALLLVIVGLIASSVPAWRAARVDPAQVLRLG